MHATQHSTVQHSIVWCCCTVWRVTVVDGRAEAALCKDTKTKGRRRRSQKVGTPVVGQVETDQAPARRYPRSMQASVRGCRKQRALQATGEEESVQALGQSAMLCALMKTSQGRPNKVAPAQVTDGLHRTDWTHGLRASHGGIRAPWAHNQSSAGSFQCQIPPRQERAW